MSLNKVYKNKLLRRLAKNKAMVFVTYTIYVLVVVIVLIAAYEALK